VSTAEGRGSAGGRDFAAKLQLRVDEVARGERWNGASVLGGEETGQHAALIRLMNDDAGGQL
jgi:hypothetical protein